MPGERVSIGFAVGTQPPLGRVRVSLALAKGVRFDVAWVTDHFMSFFPESIWNEEFSWVAREGSSPHPYYDYQAMLGWLATKAGRLQLGVGVTEPIRRHPVLLAQTFLTLSHLTRRPPILGIGSGERENTEPYGLDFSQPVGRLEEALQIIRLCFESRGPFAFEGKHFSIPDAVMDLQPGRGGTPEIWVAAHGPRMLRLTGEYGDGWYPTLPMTPDEYAESLGRIHEAARSSGRDPAGITAGNQVFAVIDKTDAAARALLGHRAIRFSALLAPAYVWRKFGHDHPLGDDFGGLIDFVPHRYAKAELEAALDKTPVDLVAEAVIWGSQESVLRQLRALVDAGMRHVVLAPLSALASRRNVLGTLRATVSVLRRLRSGD